MQPASHAHQAPATLEGLSTCSRYTLLANGHLRFAALLRPTQEVPTAWKGFLAGGAIGDLGDPQDADPYDQRVAVLRTLRQTLVERWGSAQAVNDALRFGVTPHFRQARDLLVLANEGNEYVTELASRPLEELETQLAALSQVVRYYDACAMRVTSLVDKGEVRRNQRLVPADVRGLAYGLRQHRLAEIPVAARDGIRAAFHRSLEIFLDSNPKGATPLQVATLLTQTIAQFKAAGEAAGGPQDAKSTKS